MKPIWIAAAVLAGTIAFVGCKNRKEEPVPPPNAAWAAAVKPPARGQHDTLAHRGAAGISWFQGTLEEAFSTTCHKCIVMFRR